MENVISKPIKIGQGMIVISNANAATMQVLIVLLTFFTIMTPRDVLGFKKLFLGLALVFGIEPIIKGLGKNHKILVFSLILPMVMYIVSTIDTGSPTWAFSYLYPFVYLLLVACLPYNEMEHRYTKNYASCRKYYGDYYFCFVHT